MNVNLERCTFRIVNLPGVAKGKTQLSSGLIVFSVMSPGTCPLNPISCKLWRQHSDHCPLLSNQSGPPRRKLFKFENFWTQLPDFQNVIQAAWAETNPHTEPYQRLHFRLATAAKRLKEWSRSLISGNKLQLKMALEVILRLDVAQESRPLTASERDLRTRLKHRVVGLSVLERARKRQSSRIRNLKLGDANTKKFHLKVNSRRRKNFIQRLQNDKGWAIDHVEKQNIVQEHFTCMLSRPPARTSDLN